MSLLKQPSFFMEPIGEEPIGAPGVPVPKDRLNRLIVGGGIGGLTAAIALRRNGHQVTVSDFKPRFSQGRLFSAIVK